MSAEKNFSNQESVCEQKKKPSTAFKKFFVANIWTSQVSSSLVC